MARYSRRRHLSAVEDLEPNPEPGLVAQIAANPIVFAIGIGVANGVLAAVRNKPVSQRALWATAAVLAVGETILVLDEPEEERPDLWKFAGSTALGVFIGLAPFTSWKAGQKSLIQQGGEWIGDQFSPAQPVAA